MIARLMIVILALAPGLALAGNFPPGPLCGAAPMPPYPGCSRQPTCVCDAKGECQFIWQC